MSTHYDVQALPAEQREHILRGFGLGWWRQLGQVAIVFGVVLLACWYVGLLDATTLLNGLPSIATLAGEAMPPDFSGYRSWIRPLIDTLAMSIAGTAIAVVFSLVVAFVAARNTAPHPLVFGVARVLLNALRSVPELIMGIIFVAAVGFGALPGVLALVCIRSAWSASSSPRPSSTSTKRRWKPLGRRGLRRCKCCCTRFCHR